MWKGLGTWILLGGSVEPCLESHSGILLHQRHSIVLSSHYNLAPDCSLHADPSAVRGVQLWSPLLCLTTKTSRSSTLDCPQWLWVLIVEQTVLTWHCMLSCSLLCLFPLLGHGSVRLCATVLAYE